MIILEKSKDGILFIKRVLRQGDEIRSDVELVCINSFESISSDGWNIEIVINSHCSYEIAIENKSHIKDFIFKITQSLMRDDKINMILG